MTHSLNNEIQPHGGSAQEMGKLGDVNNELQSRLPVGKNDNVWGQVQMANNTDVPSLEKYADQLKKCPNTPHCI